MTNWYADWCSSLTGGGDGAVDAIDGASVSDGCMVVAVTNSGAFIYQLDADSALAESSPGIIKPDSNAGDKRWILKDAYTSAKVNYVSRGDPAAVDIGPATLTTDGSWHDWVLPAAVAASSLVRIRLQLIDDAAGSFLMLRTKGNSNEVAIEQVFTQVANLSAERVVEVKCDANKTIQYKASNVTFTSIYGVVVGWFV